MAAVYTHFYIGFHQHCLLLQPKSTAASLQYLLSPFPGSVLAALTPGQLHKQSDSPSTARRDPTTLLLALAILTLHPSTQLQQHNLEP